jgi:hypothetical protein
MVLRLRQASPDWNQAKCAGMATGEANDPWFDNSQEDGGLDETEEARDLCNGVADGVVCPLREACLIFAALNNERYGVWGGMTESDRRLMRKIYPWDSKNPSEPHPEWRWYSSDELQELLAVKIERGEISRKQLETEDDDEAYC